MKCELCGKRINLYGKYSAVIAGEEHYLCVWCYRKIKKGKELLSKLLKEYKHDLEVIERECV